MLIPILIFGVLAIALVFFLIKSADTWNWVPITFVALIFLTSIFGGIAASRSLKVRKAWKEQYLKNEVALVRVKRAYEEALYGPENSVEGYGTGSLRDVSSRLRLAQLGKGRVWAGGSPTRNGEQFTLTFSPAAGTSSPASQIVQDMQLFAFEASDRIVVPGGGSPPPADFLGSFKVISVDTGNDSVTVEPVFMTKFYRTGSLMRQLSAELATNTNADKINRLFIELEMELVGDLKTEFMNAWNGAQAAGDMSTVTTWLDDNATAFEPVRNWALFEKMPGDSRSAFMEHSGLQMFDDDNPATPEKLAEYRQLLASTYLPADLMGMDPVGASYEELLDQYTFDGVKLNEITLYINQNSAERISDRFTMADDPENIVGKVRFNATSEAFPVDGSGNMRTDGRFTFTGLAIDPDLHLGRDVTFSKDMEVILSKIAATIGIKLSDDVTQPSIVSRNDADWIEVEYFQRPLRDYPYQLRELRDLTRKASSQRRAIEADIAVTEKIKADTQAQIDNRSLIDANLNEDIKSMQAALDEITRLHDLRAAELEACRVQIRTYYNQIIELYKQSDQSIEFLDTSADKPNGTLAESSR